MSGLTTIPGPEATDGSAKCLTTDLSWLLAQANHVLATELTAALEGLGVAPRGHCVLSTASSGEYTQTELARAVGLDKTTMVVTIDELETAGLAQRRRSTTDRRAHVISVTEAGRRKVAEAQKVIDQIQNDVLGSLPADERAMLMDALVRLVGDRLSSPVACERPVRRRIPRS